MSISLPINTFIVPADVTRAYIANYTLSLQREIEDLYQTIKARKLADVRVADGGPKAQVIIAPQGAGKSRLVKQLSRESGINFVDCDVDEMLLSMPHIKNALNAINNHILSVFDAAGDYSEISHRSMAEQAVADLRGAGQYMRDHLAAECLQEGYNVRFHVSGKTLRIGTFLEAMTKTGVPVEAHMIDCPKTLARKGAQEPIHGFSHPEAVLSAEHEAFRKNIPMIVASCPSVTLWWRQAGMDTQPACSFTPNGNFRRDGADLFEAHHADTDDLSFDSLSLEREPYRPVVTAKPATYAPSA